MNKIIVALIYIFIASAHASQIEIYGHRGAAGLAPENTIFGYKTALELGVNVIDMDVVLSKDGEVIVAHNSTVSPDFTQENGHWVKNQNTRFNQLTLREIQDKYTVGITKSNTRSAQEFPYKRDVKNEKIPSLKQVIKFVEKEAKYPVRYQIELKTSPVDNSYPDYKQLVPAVIDVINTMNIIEKVEFQSFDWRALMLAKKLQSKLSLSFVTEENDGLELWTGDKKLSAYNNNLIKMLKAAGASTWNPDYNDLTADRVKQAHKAGIRVVPWSVDDESDLTRMIDYQVDGIITNRPDKLRGLLAARQLL